MEANNCEEKRFVKKFLLSMALFLVLIAVQTFTIELMDLSTVLIIVVTIIPVLPLVWAFLIYRERFLALDEYMQRLTGEAFLWTIGIVCFGTFIYGMLAMKQLVPEVSMSFIMPVVFGGHGLVLQLLIMADEREK